MTRYQPRRAAAAPRWFVAVLLAGAAALTAASATVPNTPAHTSTPWRTAP